MKWNPAYPIFLVGLLPLLVAYYPLKGVLSPWVFVAAAVLYLVVLRLFADYLSLRLMAEPDSDSEAD